MDAVGEVAQLASTVTFRGSNSGVVEWVSDSVQTVTGRPAALLVGVRFVDLVHPDDREVVRTAQSALLDGESVLFEVRIDCATGWRWMSIAVQPVLGVDGEVMGRAGGWRDVDEERRRRDEMALLNRRFRLLAEHTLDVVCSFQPDSILDWVSPSLRTVLGYEPDDVVGTHVSWLHPDDRDAVVDRVTDAMRMGDSPVQCRARAVAADGGSVWMDIEIQIDDRGDPRGPWFTTVLHDVTALVQRDAELTEFAQRTEDLLRRREVVLGSLLDPMLVLAAVRSPAGTIVDFTYGLASGSAVEYFGLPLDELMGASMLESFPAQRTSGLFDSCVRAVETQTSIRWQAQPLPQTSTGTIRLYDLSIVPAGNDVAVTWRDVTDESHRNHELVETLAHKQAVLNASPVGLVIHRPDGSISDANPAAERLLGLTRGQVLGLVEPHPDWSLLREDGAPLEFDEIPVQRVRTSGIPVRDVTVAVQHPSGRRTWLSVNAEPFGGQPNGFGVVVAFSDITAVHNELDDVETLVDSSPDVILRIDYDGIIRWASQASLMLLDTPPDALIGKRNLDIIHPADHALLDGVASNLATRHEPSYLTLRVQRGDGTWMWVNAASADADVTPGTSRYRIVHLRDVDAETRALEQLARQATHDELTGALNRSSGLAQLAALVQSPSELSAGVAVMFIDLDDFKSVNDTYGHRAGDLLLRHVVTQIRSRVRHDDLVIRLGGDEIVVVLSHTRALPDIEHAADQIRLEASSPVIVDDAVITPCLSCGLTLVNPNSDSVAKILDRADTAMYTAKRHGGNRVTSYR